MKKLLVRIAYSATTVALLALVLEAGKKVGSPPH
jgi:hypothetical protein